MTRRRATTWSGFIAVLLGSSSSMATSSASGPPLALGPRRQPGRQVAAACAAARSRAATSTSPSTSSRSPPALRRGRPSIRPSVYISSDQPAPASATSVAGRARPAHAEHEARPAPHGSARPPASSIGGGWPASRTGPARGQVDAWRPATVANISSERRSLDQHLLQRGAGSWSVGHAGQHQRPPGDPQLHAERGLVDAVPAHVADRARAAGPSAACTTSKKSPPSRPGAGPAGRRCAPRPASVASSAAAAAGRVPAGPTRPARSSDLAQPPGVLVGPLALDRVAQRAGQQHAVDLALDQVVLRALGDRGGAQVLVVAGRSARTRRRRRRPASTWRSPSRPWRRAARGRAARSAPRAAAAGPPAASGATSRSNGASASREQLLDQERVALVVLDEQHADALAGAQAQPPVPKVDRRADVGHAHTPAAGAGSCRAAHMGTILPYLTACCTCGCSVSAAVAASPHSCCVLPLDRLSPVHGLENIVGLIAVVVATSVVARRIGVLSPILLVLVGIGISLHPRRPGDRARPGGGADRRPAAPSCTSRRWRPRFRRSGSTCGRSCCSRSGSCCSPRPRRASSLHALLPQVPLAACFALGAVVAPPDAVAATAVARRIGLPRRIVTVLEGESLLNDATALVTLRVAVAAAVGAGGRRLVDHLDGLDRGRRRRRDRRRRRRRARLLHKRIKNPLIDNALSLLTPWRGVPAGGERSTPPAWSRSWSPGSPRPPDADADVGRVPAADGRLLADGEVPAGGAGLPARRAAAAGAHRPRCDALVLVHSAASAAVVLAW